MNDRTAPSVLQPTSNDNCPSVVLLKFDFLGAAWGQAAIRPRRKDCSF